MFISDPVVPGQMLTPIAGPDAIPAEDFDAAALGAILRPR
jgi:hypothetical protein